MSFYSESLVLRDPFFNSSLRLWAAHDTTSIGGVVGRAIREMPPVSHRMVHGIAEQRGRLRARRRRLQNALAAQDLMDTSVTSRIARLDWARIRAGLDERGYATTEPLLTPSECAGIVALYDQRERFRSRIEMERFRFGVGEYKYFAAPLPLLIQTLRAGLYPPLAPTANRWMASLRAAYRYPDELDTFLTRCHRAGQRRPTPLLLRYGEGGYNCLHQDIYGEVAFPLQVVFALNQRELDYTGGEFLLVEQRPRAQSR